MPIYEYQCQDCGHEMEKLQRMSDAPLVDCPSCEKPALKKLISAAAFRLKGSGWYETDFKKDGKRNLAEGSESAKSDDKSADKSGESSGKGSEAKSDSKSSDSKSSSSGSSSGSSGKSDKSESGKSTSKASTASSAA